MRVRFRPGFFNLGYSTPYMGFRQNLKILKHTSSNTVIKNIKIYACMHDYDIDFGVGILNQTLEIKYTVDLLILARYRDRTVSVTNLWTQISHTNRTLSTVPLI